MELVITNIHSRTMIKLKLKSALRRLKDSFLVLSGNSFAFSKKKFSCYSFSFSQEGEDGILGRIFERQEKGFYVDIGAHHPQRFSNTYRFYLRGWSGINVDPLPGSKDRFDKLRSRDINLQLGVFEQEGHLLYYNFEEPALNTFNEAVAKSHNSPLVSIEKIPVTTLKSILDMYLPKETHIDFLSVDVEGLDEQVLRSNDWTYYRPSYVLAECLGMKDISHVEKSSLHAYMAEVGYSLYAKCVNTLFFINQDLIK